MKKPCLILFFVFVGEWLGGVCVQPAWAADPLKILKSASQASRVAEVVKGTAVSSLSQKVVVKAMQSSASSILSLPGDRSLSLPKQELSSQKQLSHVKNPTPLPEYLYPQLPKEDLPLLRSTFQARQAGAKWSNLYSGFVFKTIYNGKEEIFGVVAAHAISGNDGDLRLNKEFTADVFTNREHVSIPATIVQTAAPDLLDIALVRFRPEDEKLFTPLVLAREEPVLEERLQSQGFASRQVVYIPQRFLFQRNPISLRTTLPWPREQRSGLCGAPVLNQNNEVVGIHTGSAYASFGEEGDWGYATHAKFLNTLVEAYHNSGKAYFPFEVGGYKVIDLRPDEFISEISLLDDREREVFHHSLCGKFSYRIITPALRNLSARYIKFKVQRVQWSGENEEFLEKKAAWKDGNCVIYTYDIEQQQIVDQERQRTPF